MPEVALPDLRERVALRMRQIGLTQQELARASGISEPQISKILSGRIRHPTSEQITRLAVGLGITTDYLIGSDCPPTEADLPPDLRAQIAALPLWARELVGPLIEQGGQLPDTDEGRASFVRAIEVAVGYLESEIKRHRAEP